MSEADSSADPEPPNSGSTTDNKYMQKGKSCFSPPVQKHYGCLKIHPLHFHTEISRPKAPFNPRVFDWSKTTTLSPKLFLM
ncbi:hypothetical protein TVAG_172850 [Trichomonas vaginalis G3]|uniref:Uncharacterized protein n=1 Tax=Trichomonas vaginalis (strain ATCC PRA-98 / G3) TaxID=412133 RepID=A2DF36_TRIV3|nr:hypothetical protein TVAGG3_0531830 [Trichomonas vaginalis G3]EAY21028.1 hypothetical protein TVAG_172850 [Trichomonas vaginalis G3]KAI5519203.1 hypothetical protein TVAGG3_0531830 [Trichomonas vaginalis G3]|eukprot:XP_001582014.1 hypothetical protein [Trichomonas vaginalis G3]